MRHFNVIYCLVFALLGFLIGYVTFAGDLQFPKETTGKDMLDRPIRSTHDVSSFIRSMPVVPQDLARREAFDILYYYMHHTTDHDRKVGTAIEVLKSPDLFLDDGDMVWPKNPQR